MKMPGESRVVADTVKAASFASVVHAFIASEKFKALASSTQDHYRRYLLIAAHPDVLGKVPVGVVRPSVIQRLLDSFADRPGAQHIIHTALRSLEEWAVVRDLLPFPIMTGTKCVQSDGGHQPWNERQVAMAEHHARPAVSRIVTMAVNTGQRGGDLVKMRWSDIEKVQGRPGINVVQQKTGKQLWVPFTDGLQAAIEGWERRPGFILLKDDGQPYGNRKQLSMAWERDRDGNPELASCAGLVLHGLRATAVVRLRQAGVPSPMIADMVGMSVTMIERYCRLSNQKDNAMAAIHYLNRTTSERAGLSVSERPTKTRG